MTAGNWLTVLVIAISLLIPLAKWMARVASDLRAISDKLTSALERIGALHKEHDELRDVVSGHEVRIVKLESKP